MNIIFIGRGNATLGRVTHDAHGNETGKIPAQWDFDPKGGCVAVGELDPETMEQVGAASVFGDWEASHYLAKVLDLLGPGRKTNLPDMTMIIKGAIMDGVDLCEYCPKQDGCRDCIITELKLEVENIGETT